MHGRPATATSSAIQRVAPFARIWAHFSAEHFRFVMIVVLYPMRVPTRAREQPVLPDDAARIVLGRPVVGLVSRLLSCACWRMDLATRSLCVDGEGTVG